MTKTFLDREASDRGPVRRRGPKRFIFTYKTYASVLGVSVKTLQNAVSLGKFDPSDFQSVLAYVNARLVKKATRRP